MALLHLPSLGGPSRQPLHPAAGARVQGIRGTDGTDTLSNASDLRTDIEVCQTRVRKPYTPDQTSAWKSSSQPSSHETKNFLGLGPLNLPFRSESKGQN